MRENYNSILDPVESILSYGNEDSPIFANLAVYIVLPGEKGLRPIHHDSSSNKIINLYLALSNITSFHSPMSFYLGTDVNIEGSPFRAATLNSTFAKASAIGLESVFYNMIEKLAGINTLLLGGLTDVYLMYEQFKNKPNVPGKFVEQNKGEFIMFPLNLWHQSTSSTNENTNCANSPRVALSMRLSKEDCFFPSVNGGEGVIKSISEEYNLDIDNTINTLITRPKQDCIPSVLINKNFSNDHSNFITLPALENYFNALEKRTEYQEHFTINKLLISSVNQVTTFTLLDYSDKSIFIFGFKKEDTIKIDGLCQNVIFNDLEFEQNYILNFTNKGQNIYVDNIKSHYVLCDNSQIMLSGKNYDGLGHKNHMDDL